MPVLFSRAFSRARFLLLPLTLTLAAACGSPAQPPPAEAARQSEASGNLTEGCADSFDEDRDYFPDKVRFAHATGVRVTYEGNTKLLEISRPWKDADATVRVLLVQCGTPTPPHAQADAVVQVPVRRVATFSTTQLPPFAELDRLDAVVAHGGLKYATTPEVLEAARAGEIAEVGDQTAPDLEALATADLDVALTSAGVEDDADRQGIGRVGAPVLPYADWLEETLLGRAEWAKVVALLLNQEAAAERSFANIEQAYRRTVARAEELRDGPEVFVGMPYEGIWYMPAGQSYVARALGELGARYPWADTKGTGALSLDLETVLAEASDAGVWLAAGSARGTLADLAAADERFRGLAAFQSGEVYADDAAATPEGGNPVFELGAVRPDLVLADLFKALYPENAADLDFTFYGRVGSAADTG